MDTSQRISQAVSLIPVLISIIILFVAGAGSWFVVKEDFYPPATSDETVVLDSGVVPEHLVITDAESETGSYAFTIVFQRVV